MVGTQLNCRNLASVALAILLPVSMAAQEAAGAMLRDNGGVLLNRNPAPPANAVYRNDLIETQKAALARIEMTGSSADINPETVVQFEDDELVLDHGSLSVNTSHGVRVRVGCLTVQPVNPNDWTQYEVADVDGKVTVSARKSDVYIEVRSKNLQEIKQSTESGKSNRSIVREGEQKSRDEKCAAGDQWQSSLGGPGAILNSRWAVGAGAILVGGAICWALCFHGDEPISPSTP